MTKVSRGGIAKAAGIIMVAMMLSRILGYARDVVIYAKFGQVYLTDAYNAAFSIPDFLFYLLVGGALSTAFIPVFSSYIATNNEEEAWEVASTIFNFIMILMMAGITLGLIFTPQLVKLLVPGFDEQGLALTVQLTRVMFIQSFFMGLSGISQGILHSHKHFLAPALGSVLYNIGIIVIGLLLMEPFGIMGFTIGVVVGSMANFLVQVPALMKVGLKYKFTLNLKHPGVKKIGLLVLPVLIGLSVNHLNLFVNQNLASTLPEGMISALRAAQRVMQLPIGVFAVGIALAVFPTLTDQAARKDIEAFKKTMSVGLRTVIFITLPAAVGIIALRVPIIRALFQQGEFTISNTEATAYALLFYSIGLIGYSAQQILNRAFYAMQDTVTPVTVGIITIIINLVLNFALIKPLAQGGLALAYSIAGLVNMALLLFFFRRKVGNIDGRRIFASVGKISFASLIMAGVVYFSAYLFEINFNMGLKVFQIVQVMTAITLGSIVYGGMAWLMKMEEAEMAMGILMRRFKRKR